MQLSPNILFKKIMFRLFAKNGFGKVLLSSYQSKAYGEFCLRVYGRNLCQLNMLDEEQLQKLLSELSLNPTHRVLDLGCGIGMVAEYISDTTGAHLTGLDFATKVIKSAQLRTTKKKDRLIFIEGNLNSLPKTLGKFDFIISIDTLYFADDLEKTVRTMTGLLVPGGKIAIFYSPSNARSRSAEDLMPNTNKLAKVLNLLQLEYKFWDFGQNQNKIWQQTSQIAEDLKEQFRAEKNMLLYNGRKNESKSILQEIANGSTARYMYVVTCC
jgi:ubiquinone/menaquinone biosynthesis C-methylase UbiE